MRRKSGTGLCGDWKCVRVGAGLCLYTCGMVGLVSGKLVGVYFVEKLCYGSAFMFDRIDAICSVLLKPCLINEIAECGVNIGSD